MNKPQVDKQLMAGIIALIVLGALVAFSIFFDRSTTESKPGQSTFTAEAPEPTSSPTPSRAKLNVQTILNDTLKDIKNQQKVDESILQELQSGAYTLDKPLIVVDPYSESPLTALVVFSTEKPVKISIHVPGEDALTDIDFTFDGYSQEHLVPVYGLYPATTNKVTVTAETEDGKKSQSVLEIETGPLPKELAGMIRLVDWLNRRSINLASTSHISTTKNIQKLLSTLTGRSAGIYYLIL
jgi:arylsulfate sulfotransferase